MAVTEARSLDRTSPVPLWAQLASELRGRLARGEFDRRFPTERELTEAYGVSRNTVREALRQLGHQGLLERQRGRGTTVRPRELEQLLGGPYSLHATLEAQGVDQSSQVRSLSLGCHPQAAAALGREPDAELVYLERLRLADQAPLAWDRSWLPAELARPLLHCDFARLGLYRQLRDRCGVELTGGEERIRPVVPSGPERALLGLGPGQAAFFVERLVRSGGRSVEYRQTLVRGDRFSFVSRWSEALAP